MTKNQNALAVRQLRCETRMKVLLSGELQVGGGAVGCRVHDISRGGACLESDRRPALGETIRFVRGPLEASGRVAWIRGRRFGLCFDTPIRATDLLVQMSHSRQGGSTPTPAPTSELRLSLLSPSM